MDEKVTSNGNVDVWAILATDVADVNSPTATEINTDGVRLTPAIAWEGTTFPTASESNDIDDRSLDDRGNATTRGFAQFEATLNFFRPRDVKDTVSDYGKAYQLFKQTRVPVILVTRVAQRTTDGVTPAAAGQWISVYEFITGSFVDDTEGEDSYKYAVSFMPQGNLAVNTQVKNATPVSLTAEATSVAVGAHVTIRATLGGKRATQAVIWNSSNDAVATVSPNGVVTGVSAGTASITATHPAATGATTPVTITVS
jgi:hypothetical protein